MAQMVIDIGDDTPFHEAIVLYIRRKYNLVIGVRTAQRIQVAIGSAMPLDANLVSEVQGRDLLTGLPRTISINENEATEAMTEPLGAVANNVRRMLEALSEERANEVLEEGVIITGRAVLVRNVAAFLEEVVGVRFFVAVDPTND